MDPFGLSLGNEPLVTGLGIYGAFPRSGKPPSLIHVFTRYFHFHKLISALLLAGVAIWSLLNRHSKMGIKSGRILLKKQLRHQGLLKGNEKSAS